MTFKSKIWLRQSMWRKRTTTTTTTTTTRWKATWNQFL